MLKEKNWKCLNVGVRFNFTYNNHIFLIASYHWLAVYGLISFFFFYCEHSTGFFLKDDFPLSPVGMLQVFLAWKKGKDGKAWCLYLWQTFNSVGLTKACFHCIYGLKYIIHFFKSWGKPFKNVKLKLHGDCHAGLGARTTSALERHCDWCSCGLHFNIILEA